MEPREAPPPAAPRSSGADADRRPAVVIDRVLIALSALRELGEAVQDEWLYVTELEQLWRERLLGVAAALGVKPLPPDAVEAVDEAIHEVGLIGDPHRAIDWLSTFPQVVAVALGPSVPRRG